MATYRVWSGASGANNGTSWTDAFTTRDAAYAAATAALDVILIHKTHIETFAANKSFTALNHIAVLCVDKDNSDAPAEMDGTTGYFSNSSAFSFLGAYSVYERGIWYTHTSSSTGQMIKVASGDNVRYAMEDCTLKLSNASGFSTISFGNDGAQNNSAVMLKNTDLVFGNSNQGLNLYCRFEMEGGAIAGASASTLLKAINNGATNPVFVGVDLSIQAGTLVYDSASRAVDVYFVDCDMHASSTPLATQTAGIAGASTWMLNCSAGGIKRMIGHYNALGQTTVSASIYANDGLMYDDTNRCSWEIISSAAATIYSPYVSPMIDVFDAGSSAITPWIECLRDGSSTAYQDDEVWPEFIYQSSASSPISTFVSSRMTFLGTPANITTSSKGASDWTGEGGTAWFGKLTLPSSITPLKPGSLKARICVGSPSTTIYIDPQIRV